LARYQTTKDSKRLQDDSAQEVDVDIDHFKNVVRMSREFQNYMTSVSAKDEVERARQRSERNDNYRPGEE